MKTYSRKKGDSPSNVIIHMNELCRLCLAKEEEMVPIYEDKSLPVPLALRIYACVNVEVSFLFPRSGSRKRRARDWRQKTMIYTTEASFSPIEK